MEEKKMKMIRRFSLMIVLAILVTVGGVYAQWVYEDHNFVGGEANNIDLSMQAYMNPGNQQGYFVEKYVNMMVEIADNYRGDEYVGEGVKGDYHADVNGHGSMLFLFKAYELTTFTDMSSLYFNITFKEQNPIVYNDGTKDIPIFTYRDATNKQLTALTADNVDDVASRYANLNKESIMAELTTAEKPGLYFIELTYDHLFVEDIDNAIDGVQTHVALSDEFKGTAIDNLEKWDVLQEAILGGSVTVYITDTRQPAGATN